MKLRINWKEVHIKNPTLEQAEGFVKLAKLMSATSVETIGGGSIIDIGKWIARQLNIPHTAIPTTAGTGSEVTKYCVLTVDGKKKTFTDEKFIPTSYILDPKHIKTLKEDKRLSPMLDAYCQAMESSWSVHATDESMAYAEMAINLIEKEKNDMDLMIAANMSGRAINIARTNVCHAISYSLTDLYGIPHGFACYMTLKYFATKLGIPVKKFNIPKFDFDAKIVADIAILNEKMKDYRFEVTRQDIIDALKQ